MQAKVSTGARSCSVSRAASPWPGPGGRPARSRPLRRRCATVAGATRPGGGCPRPTAGGPYYGHLNTFRVKNGASVSAGQRIADMGATGNVTGPHLHFEVQIGDIGDDVNPRTHVSNRGVVLGGGWPTLDPESRGQRVRAMQYLLRQRGRSITVDGYHGPQSTATPVASPIRRSRTSRAPTSW